MNCIGTKKHPPKNRRVKNVLFFYNLTAVQSVINYFLLVLLRAKKIAAVPETSTRRIISAIEASPVLTVALVVVLVLSFVAVSEVALEVVGATVAVGTGSVVVGTGSVVVGTGSVVVGTGAVVVGTGAVVVGSTVVGSTVVGSTVVGSTVVGSTVVGGLSSCGLGLVTIVKEKVGKSYINCSLTCFKGIKGKNDEFICRL